MYLEGQHLSPLEKLFWWIYQENSGSSTNDSGGEPQTKSSVPNNSVTHTSVKTPKTMDEEEVNEIESHFDKEGAAFRHKQDRNHNNVTLETFASIRSLLFTISNRPNNAEMEYLHHSRTGSVEFTQTFSYKEALELLREGYSDIVEEVNSSVTKKVNAFHKDQYQVSPPASDLVGIVPIVPNAIMGLPNSMVRKQPKVGITKCLHLIYFQVGPCVRSLEEFKQAGITLLSAIRILERQRIKIRIDVGFYGGTDKFGDNGVKYGGIVKLKDYSDRLNILKLCFPLAHPSMFRRIGFKWLETVPDLKGDFRDDYGNAMPPHVFRDAFGFDNAVVLVTDDIIAMNYGVNQLLNFIKEQCKNLD